jgi:DNA-binding NarL/FixJ family response regulator
VREQKPAARILIADDHQLLADACKSLLEPEFQVVGVVTDGRRLIAAATELRPDIIILDIHMPHLNGLDAGGQVKSKLPGVKLVFLTMTMEAEVAAEAFRRGASAYVLKQSAGDELLLAVRKVSQGASYLSPLIAKETMTYLLNQEAISGGEKGITTKAERNSSATRGGDVDERGSESPRHKARHSCLSQVSDDADTERQDERRTP